VFLASSSSTLFAPFQADDANVHTTKCRSITYIPFDLIEIQMGAYAASCIGIFRA
jgi:hypothetical protein